MKKNEINAEISIEEKKKILLEAIESSRPAKKKEALLTPFIPEIKLMLEKKMPISSQLKALDSIGIKITYKTYKAFLDSLSSEAKTLDLKEPGEKIAIVLNDKGAVKTYAVKDTVKKLGFLWAQDRKGWKKEVSPEELEKVKELKVGYDII
ncbi:MAG: hypothetical protein M1584_01640 [Deltaproteobacteria bacterium]|nr:hypothetical protein [Deltaproteobacteria bacterium]